MANLMDKLRQAQEETQNRYWVHLRFRNHVLGGQPATERAMEGWLASKKVDPKHIEAQIAQLGQASTVEEAKEDTSNVFMSDDYGPYLMAYQFKRALTEMFSATGVTVAQRGSKQTVQHLADVVAGTPDQQSTVRPGEHSPDADKVYFYRDGARLNKIDGFKMHTGQTNGPQGPRSFVKHMAFVEHADVYIVIVLPARIHATRASAVISEENLIDALARLGNNGVGASRSQGAGSFDIVALERLDDNPATIGKVGKGSGKKDDDGEEITVEEAAPATGEASAAPADAAAPVKRKPGRPPKPK